MLPNMSEAGQDITMGRQVEQLFGLNHLSLEEEV